MPPSRVFIASSSEAGKVTKEVHRPLLHWLGHEAEIEPWTRNFELSATFIESLEEEIRQSDFAILILTPDDDTKIRGGEEALPA